MADCQKLAPIIISLAEYKARGKSPAMKPAENPPTKFKGFEKKNLKAGPPPTMELSMLLSSSSLVEPIIQSLMEPSSIKN